MFTFLNRYRVKIWQIVLYGIVVVAGDYFGNVMTFNTISHFCLFTRIRFGNTTIDVCVNTSDDKIQISRFFVEFQCISFITC